jgi:hypothetical protein
MEIPSGLLFNGTVVGGLSSIDYDAKRKLYYIICDDPGARSPTRFYTAKITIGGKGIDSVSLVAVTTVQNSLGNPYTDITKDRIHSLDAESLRYNPIADEFVIGSEGQRVHNADNWEIEDPSIVVQHRDGSFKDSFPLPPNMHVHQEEKGARHNVVFEGLTFTDDYRFLYAAPESPIYEDGYPAGLGDSTAWIRISKYDARTRKLIAQYPYLVNPVPYPAIPQGAFKINGVTDILYFSKDNLLVLERGYSTGRGPSDIRIFIADASKWQDISSVSSLKNEESRQSFPKKLLFNFEKLGRYIDNVEGVTFGPRLPNGHQTLIFVTDNDFLMTRKTQFFLFEVIP